MVAPCSLAQPIRRVSACKGCCLAPGNLEEGWPNTRKEAPQRHKKNSYSVLSLKFEPNVQLMLVACGTQCFTEPMPGSLTMQASSARIASLDTRSSSRVPIDWTLLETYEKRIRNVFNAFLSCTSSTIIYIRYSTIYLSHWGHWWTFHTAPLRWRWHSENAMLPKDKDFHSAANLWS